MAKQTYKIRPVEEKEGKIKNITIIVLSALLVFSIICIFSTVNVSYIPTYNAVRENTELKQRISELEDQIDELNAQLKSSVAKNNTEEAIGIVPPNQHVDGYDDYQKSMESFNEKNKSLE